MVGAVGAFSNAYLYQSTSNSSSENVAKTEDSQQMEELLAQSSQKSGKPQGPPPGGGGQPPQEQSLTDDESKTISEILEEYDSENLTEEDALAIASAFEEAGIQVGSGLKDAIEENGFDPETLGELAGFEQRPPQGGQEISQMMMQEEIAQLSTDANENLYESMEQAFSAMVAGFYSEQSSTAGQESYFNLSA